MTVYNFLARIYDFENVRIFLCDHSGDIGFWDELTFFQKTKYRNKFITRFEFIRGAKVIVKVKVV